MAYAPKKLLIFGSLVLLLSGALAMYATDNTATTGVALLDVYKSPDCGCCQGWIDHAESEGIEILAHNTNRLSEIKAERSILPKYQSCHTSISEDGFVFEGHVPASIVKRFLTNPPADAIGLAVPGMPIGSPGMEMGDIRDDYEVLLLNSDGSVAVFERILGTK